MVFDFSLTSENKKIICWRIRVSIPVPLTCKASALPLELIPHNINTLIDEEMENPGIDPGTSHMLSERSTT